jgi:uncharacterized protein YjiS (DUF1127 family)
MTMISSAAGQPASQNSGQVSAAGLAHLLGSWANGLVTYWAHRHAIKVLSEMDDRALRDIGIARSQIEAAVGGALNAGMAQLR